MLRIEDNKPKREAFIPPVSPYSCVNMTNIKNTIVNFTEKRKRKKKKKVTKTESITAKKKKRQQHL